MKKRIKKGKLITGGSDGDVLLKTNRTYIFFTYEDFFKGFIGKDVIITIEESNKKDKQ